MRSGLIFGAAMALLLGGAAVAQQDSGETAPAEPSGAQLAESWLPSLVTETPEEGFALALTLARRGVTSTQPDREVLFALRPHYSRDADSLIAASQVVAIHFQTIAAANNYWR